MVTGLRKFEYFSIFDEEEVAIMAETARAVRYPAGQRLFHEGAPASGCWLIERGQIDLDSTQAESSPVVLQSLGAGELVGWSWLLPPYRWHFGGVTATPVTAIMFDTDQLKSQFDQHPRLGYRFARRACETVLRRLQASRAQAVEYQLRLKSGTRKDRSLDSGVIQVDDLP